MGLPRGWPLLRISRQQQNGCYDDRTRTLTDADWRDENDSDASEESDEVHSTVPMKLQLNILFFEAADASVCVHKMFMPMSVVLVVTFIQK